jgi:hypothetical protein
MAGSVLTALDDVAQRLREQLADVENIPLDQEVVDTMQALLARAEASVVSLLPRRKQRAVEQMGQVVAAYREDARMKRNQRRARLVEELLAGMKPEARTDHDVLLDAWLAVVRPRWRAALQSGMTRRRRATLRRVRSLTGELQKNALTEDELTGLLDAVQAAKPVAERMVAAIIGVPA